MTAAYDTYDYPKYWNNRDYEHSSELVVLSEFFEKIKNKNSLIDIGAGHGRLCKEYVDQFKKITLVDPSKKLLQIAKKNSKKNSKKITYIQSDVESIAKKVKSKKYDVAIMVRVLHHIEEPSVAFEIVHNLLNDNGYFVFEFANKVHGKEIMKRFLKGDFLFPIDIFPSDKRSARHKKSITFLNHHPDSIENCLKNSGFKILERRSVSNIRSRRIKKRIPLNVLIMFEKWFQKPLSYVNFGPSIFILAKKTTK